AKKLVPQPSVDESEKENTEDGQPSAAKQSPKRFWGKNAKSLLDWKNELLQYILTEGRGRDPVSQSPGSILSDFVVLRFKTAKGPNKHTSRLYFVVKELQQEGLI
ncbi:hypothetical protein B566_EDAN005988, partial [Ephemera danica]